MALLRGVVSAFFLALEGPILAALVRGGDARREEICWVLGAALSAASVPALSRANRALGGFGGADCGHFSNELCQIKKSDMLSITNQSPVKLS
jgi:hypothetical protein